MEEILQKIKDLVDSATLKKINAAKTYNEVYDIAMNWASKLSMDKMNVFDQLRNLAMNLIGNSTSLHNSEQQSLIDSENTYQQESQSVYESTANSEAQAQTDSRMLSLFTSDSEVKSEIASTSEVASVSENSVSESQYYSQLDSYSKANSEIVLTSEADRGHDNSNNV